MADLLWFLARLLIKKCGLLQLKFVGVGVNIYLKSFSCILPKFDMHVTNDLFSDKFNNGKKNENGRFIAIFRILSQ